MARRRGRPRVADGLRRAKFITLRLRPADERAILQAARQAGEPHTVWMRNALLRAARRAGSR